ncbi:hypothetical protein [Pseudoxanthomonas sp.]|uniref:hypothetical protein n=1 Tax=Pseudoxanthomonas sp. TaxID=1871049 RepID=UPI00261A1449|nr:hypothetical protein [Pseudoxanthomonas sp.]WDS34753.1 MAG: hypothetical protein O8I58_10140 [Pseudoxanthomonas sp.]
MIESKDGAFDDDEWGCTHGLVSELAEERITAYRVTIRDVEKVAVELARTVMDTSWMAHLDGGTQRSYQATVSKTAQELVKIFNGIGGPGHTIAADFGEVMVSLGAGRALKQVMGHYQVPLAELWKPQVKQNEGFDFHTVCKKDLINFGEAKFSAKSSPHGLALRQIKYFISEEKHLRDRVHLINVCSKKSTDNLDLDDFGVIAAFSLNGVNPLAILGNAVDSATELLGEHKISHIYLVGVSHEA